MLLTNQNIKNAVSEPKRETFTRPNEFTGMSKSNCSVIYNKFYNY